MLEPALLRFPYQPLYPTTLHYPLQGGLMTTDSMDYFFHMYQLADHNKHTGHYFFDCNTASCFKSRVQKIPPYGGRVFVTSECHRGLRTGRRYSVREIQPDGSIETPSGYRAFASRYDAHAFAKAYAADNFIRGIRKGFVYNIVTSERV